MYRRLVPQYLKYLNEGSVYQDANDPAYHSGCHHPLSCQLQVRLHDETILGWRSRHGILYHPVAESLHDECMGLADNSDGTGCLRSYHQEYLPLKTAAHRSDRSGRLVSRSLGAACSLRGRSGIYTKSPASQITCTCYPK